MNKENIQLLAEGKAILKYYGNNLEGLRKVLKMAFADDLKNPSGFCKYYLSVFYVFHHNWIGVNDILDELKHLPIIPLEDFLKKVEPQPKEGDTVWVRVNESGRWVPRIYLTTVPVSLWPFITVNTKDEQAYESGKLVGHIPWKYMTTINPYPKLKLSMQQIAEKVGVSPDDIEIEKP